MIRLAARSCPSRSSLCSLKIAFNPLLHGISFVSLVAACFTCCHKTSKSHENLVDIDLRSLLYHRLKIQKYFCLVKECFSLPGLYITNNKQDSTGYSHPHHLNNFFVVFRTPQFFQHWEKPLFFQCLPKVPKVLNMLSCINFQQKWNYSLSAWKSTIRTSLPFAVQLN